VPVARSQLSEVQNLPSSQVVVVVATQAPPEHLSPVVHALPSVHVVPSVLAGLLQVPVAETQLPAA